MTLPPVPQGTTADLRRIIEDQAGEISRLRARLDELEARLASGTGSDGDDDLWRRLGLGEGERRTVTVLFADVSGFTTMAERLDPEDCTAVMRDTLRGLARVVTDRGGHVEKFIGDAVCALFGAPVAHEDEPHRAALAALDMHRWMDELAEARPHLPALTVHIGINTGTVIAGEVGDGSQFGVMGDTINTAARLMDAATSRQTFVSAATASRLRGAFELHEAGVLALKGKQQDVTAFELVGPATAPVDDGTEAPFVGRRAELEQVAARGAGRDVVVVTGPPGIGKSRLLREVAAVCDDARVLTATTRTHGARPGQLVADLVAPLVHERPDDDARRAGAAFVDDDTLAAVPDGYEAALVEVVLAAAEVQPLVLVLDGYDVVDPVSATLVPYLIERTEAADIHWVVAGRRGAAPVETVAALGRAVALPPLGIDDSVRLLEAAVPGAFAGHEDVVRQLATVAAGSPEYCGELVRALVEQGLVVAYEGAWHLVGRIDDLQTPENLRELIEARLERLDTTARRVLQAAAVIGVRFSAALLARTADEPAAVEPALVELEELQFVLPPEAGGDGYWSFRTPLLRAVVYDTILRRRRPELHRRVADGLLALHPDGRDSLAEALAFHYEAAGVSGPAAEFLERAAHRALRAHAPQQAEELVVRALSLPDLEVDRQADLERLLDEVRSR